MANDEKRDAVRVSELTAEDTEGYKVARSRVVKPALR